MRYQNCELHVDVKDSLEYVETADLDRKNGTRFLWIISSLGQNGLIGAVECSVSNNSLGVGYMLGSEHWGKGYAIEAVRLVLDWADDVGLDGAWAICDAENARSSKLLERLGFIQQRKMPASVVCPLLDSKPRDAVLYWRSVPRCQESRIATGPDAASGGWSHADFSRQAQYPGRLVEPEQDAVVRGASEPTFGRFFK